MPKPRHCRRLAAVTVLAFTLMATAACGASPGSSHTSATANVQPAEALLAPITGKATAFPVATPLSKHLPQGTKVAFLQCSASFCAIAAQALRGATNLLHFNLQVVKTSASVSDMQNAMATIIASHPKVVLVAGIDPSSIGTQLKTLTSSGVAVGTFGMIGAEQYGVQAAINAAPMQQLNGQLLAAAVVADKGARSNAVFYNTPELSFSAVVEKSFDSEMAKLCPGCTVRNVTLSVTTFGSTAPSTVVSDLQSHPSTNAAVFPTMEAASGLASAMKVANLGGIVTVGSSPTPSNLQDIKSGGLSAGLGLDAPTMIWMTLDAAMRVATTQPLTAGEKAGSPPLEYLRQQDITFNPTNGFSAYPDFAQTVREDLGHRGQLIPIINGAGG